MNPHVESICPRCKGPLLDLRDAGFNARALEREGTCFAWGKGMFTCSQRLRAPARRW